MIFGMPEDAALKARAPHPGEVLQGDYPDAASGYPGASVSEAADKLGVSRGHLSCVLHGHRPVTVELVMKLEAAAAGTRRKSGCTSRRGTISHKPASS